MKNNSLGADEAPLHGNSTETPAPDLIAEAITGDRNLVAFDLQRDHNAYPLGPIAKGRGIYRVIGWEGADRGGLLLSEAEAVAISAALCAHSAVIAKAEGRATPVRRPEE